MIDNSKATVGFSDIVWGEGYVTVTGYGGTKRKVKAVSFKDLPYDNTTTLAEKLDSISKLLNSNDITKLTEHGEEIAHLADNLDNVLKVANTKDAVYRDIVNNLDAISVVRDNLMAIHKVIDYAKEVKDTSDQLKYLKCECERLYKKNRDLNTKQQQFVEATLNTTMEKLDTTTALVEGLIKTAADDITEGHELAKKFQTYNWQLKPVPPCGKLEFHIDDANAAIVLQIPILGEGENCNCPAIDVTKKFVLPRVIVQDGQSVFPANNVTAVDPFYTYQHKVETNSVSILEDDGFIHLYKEDPVTHQLVPYTGLKKGDPIEFYISQDPAMAMGGVTVLDVWGDRSASKVVSARLSNLLNDWVQALVKLTGTPILSEDLGIFTQTGDEVIIPDGSTIKEAFQKVETYLDAIPKNFLELPDTIADYAGKAEYMLRVNVAMDKVEAVKLTADLVNYDDAVSKLGLPAGDLNVQKAIEKLKGILDGLPDQVTVANIAERDALNPPPPPNTIVHVLDASADNAINSGWAKYQFINGAWYKYLSLDDLTHFQDHTRTTMLDRTDLKPGGVSGKVFREVLDDLHLADGVFLGKTALGVNKVKPTALEVQANLDNFKDPDSGYAPRNKILYYNNKDTFTDGDTMEMVYYVNKDGKVFPLSNSEEAAIFAPDNILAPVTAKEPTLSEIEAFASPKTSVMVVYNGEDTIGAERSKYIYWIDGSSKATLIDTWNIGKLETYIEALGIVNDGVGLTLKGDLTIGITGGKLYEYDKPTNDIIEYPIIAQDPHGFKVMAPNGTIITPNSTTVPVTDYWNGTAVAQHTKSNNAAFHAFFMDKTGDLVMLMGDKSYNTFATGTRLYGNELSNVPVALKDYIYIGGLLVRKDAPKTDSSRVMKVNASKLGEIRVSGADQQSGLLRTPVADTVLLKQIPAPTNGEKRQILNVLPSLVYYTFSETDNSGIKPDDGSPGSWLSIYGTDPTQPIPDPMVGMIIYGPVGKLLSDGFLAIKAGTLTGGALMYPQAMGMHPYWVVGDDIVFPAGVDGQFLRNLGGKASNQGASVAEKQSLDLKMSTYNGNLSNAGDPTDGFANGYSSPSTNKHLGQDENAPQAMAEQAYLIVDTYTSSKIKTVDMAGLPVPAIAGDYIIRRKADNSIELIPSGSADFSTQKSNCINIIPDGSNISANQTYTITDALPAGFDIYSTTTGTLKFTFTRAGGNIEGGQVLTLDLPAKVSGPADNRWVYIGDTEGNVTQYIKQIGSTLYGYSTGALTLNYATYCERHQYFRLPEDLSVPAGVGDYMLQVDALGNKSFQPYTNTAVQFKEYSFNGWDFVEEALGGGYVRLHMYKRYKVANWGNVSITFQTPFTTVFSSTIVVEDNPGGKMNGTISTTSPTRVSYWAYVISGGITGNSNVRLTVLGKR